MSYLIKEEIYLIKENFLQLGNFCRKQNIHLNILLYLIEFYQSLNIFHIIKVHPLNIIGTQSSSN